MPRWFDRLPARPAGERARRGCAGTPSTSPMADCMSIEPRAARSRPSDCPAASCGPCVGLGGSKSLIRRSFSPRNAPHRSPPPDSASRSRGSAPRPSASPGSPTHAAAACGFHLANQGADTRSLQAYLGHKNIQHTVRYTELSPTRFKGSEAIRVVRLDLCSLGA